MYGPEETTVVEQRAVTLMCIAEGDPSPSTTWIKGGLSLHASERVQLSPNGSLVTTSFFGLFQIICWLIMSFITCLSRGQVCCLEFLILYIKVSYSNMLYQYFFSFAVIIPRYNKVMEVDEGSVLALLHNNVSYFSSTLSFGERLRPLHAPC